MQTLAGKSVLRAHIHGPWESRRRSAPRSPARALPYSLGPWDRGRWVLSFPPNSHLADGHHPVGVPWAVSSGGECRYQGPAPTGCKKRPLGRRRETSFRGSIDRCSQVPLLGLLLQPWLHGDHSILAMTGNTSKYIMGNAPPRAPCWPCTREQTLSPAANNRGLPETSPTATITDCYKGPGTVQGGKEALQQLVLDHWVSTCSRMTLTSHHTQN